VTRDFEKRLARLIVMQPAVFGADGHHFILNEPLDEMIVAEFEQRHGIRLPADYRSFITTIGNGGAGPGYGLFPFGETDAGPADEYFADLARPFPYTEAWNVLSDEETYFASVDGAIPICHMGCAIYIYLVTTGAETGNVWMDDRSSDGGWQPLRLTFLQWYDAWIEASLRGDA
jgi:hypothetical protein